MRRHTVIGQRILSAAPALTRAAALVRASHERFDGQGYPDKLAAADIPLGARVIERGGELHVPTRPLGRVDPTGAGDAFGVSYLAARADGHAPASAARRATALVAALLLGRMR